MSESIIAIAAPELAGQDIHCLPDLADLWRRQEAPAAIVLGAEATTVDAIVRLRADPGLDTRPLFLAGDATPAWLAQADGAWPGRTQALAEAERLAERLGRFPALQQAADADSRLLRYCALRPEAELAPVAAPADAALYRYPLLEGLATGKDVERWLHDLQRRGWLLRQSLVDRIRRCPDCAAGHLNYVDVCPFCGELDIHSSDALHCFVCGHVGDQGEFAQQGALICPNCYTRLRHIGVDYDRPLESMSCRSCRERFSEARVVARCLRCGASHDPGDLDSVSVGRYRLAEPVRLSAASGVLGQWADALSSLRLLPSEIFQLILGWQVETARRHPEHGFSLVGVDLGSVRQIAEQIGEGRALTLLDALSERLHQMLRSTDLVSRSQDDRLWLLLPATPAANLPVVIRRLRELEGLAEGDVPIRLRVATATIPEDLAPDEDATLLLARLGAEMTP